MRLQWALCQDRSGRRPAMVFGLLRIDGDIVWCRLAHVVGEIARMSYRENFTPMCRCLGRFIEKKKTVDLAT